MLPRQILTSSAVALPSAPSTFITSGASIPTATLGATPVPTEPCAIVSSMQAEALQSATSSSEPALIPAELGYACLQSVPVDQEGDAMLVDDIKVYLEWATDVSYLKDLPSWYDNPSFDFYDELDNIKTTIQTGGYDSEWDVQSAISNLFIQTGDDHNVWNADISTVFGFQRRALVSVSTDGKDAPEVFDYGDLRRLSFGANFSASSIEKINGVDVQTYLRNIGLQQGFHDAHARYNGLFPNQAGTSVGTQDIVGIFAAGIYDGPNTTYAYSNGTSRTFSNVAAVGKDFSGVDSGEAFFSKFCTPQPTASDQAPSSTPTANTTATESASSATATPTGAIGYPKAVVLHPGNAIGGYYLNGSTDVAVLSVPTFNPKMEVQEYDGQARDLFQKVGYEFIKQAAADGKSKLIVDLRFNGGGSTVLGFDLFKLLFPTLEPYQATRRRAQQGFKQLVDVANSQSSSLVFETDPSAPTFNESQALWEFAYQGAITSNDTEFESATQFYGPHEYNGDKFTTLRGWNLSNTFGFATNFTVSGYGGELATPEPAFNASNIILLQDGICASTCAIFSELMRTVAGVETLAIGGLPNNTIPMQKVGGTRGWLVWPLATLDYFSSSFYKYADSATINSANGTEISAMNNTSAIWKRFEAFSVNAADGIRRGDEKGQTPLQFIYEAAECRIYYTPAMIFDVTETWEGVVNAKWGNGSCAAGRGFGTLATIGDGWNQTGSTTAPPQSNSASRTSVIGMAMLVAALTAVVAM